MRKAGLVVWQAHQIAASLVRPGATTARIDRAVEELFEREGAVPLFQGVPGKVPFPAVTCISVNEEVVHGIPSDRVLEEGDIVSIDTGCRVDGWCGDAAVTHAVGWVDPHVQQLLDATRGVLDLAIDLMGKKGRWREVAVEMGEYVRDHGFSVVTEFCGHGIGRKLHEEPEVPNCDCRELRRGGDFRLRPGLVIAVEPMVNMGTSKLRCLPDHWTQVTRDGRFSAHFEHTIAITEDGPRRLTGPPGS